MNTTPRHRFLSSQDAQSLGLLTNDLVTTWIADLESCSEVNELFEALRSVFLGSLAQAAKEWNSAHDPVRLLPLELRDMCFSSLRAFDKCRLAGVCSSWRQIGAKSQALWSSVEISDREVDLRTILPRSGSLPLDVTVTHLPNSDGFIRIDTALRPHAHRLRSLKLRLSETYVSCFEPCQRVLHYAAPNLEELHLLNLSSSVDNSGRFEIPSAMFNMHAPLLRKVVLRKINFPSDGCPALSHVTHASIGARCSGLENLFAIMPSLQWLELTGMYDYNIRPAVPALSQLTEAVMRDFFLGYGELDQLGYTRLPRLTVISDGRMSVVTDAFLRLSASSHSVLTIHGSGTTEIVLRRANGSVARFSAVNISLEETRYTLCFGRELRDIPHLVLPLHFESHNWTWAANVRTASCPLFPRRGVDIELPALRSLTIRCAPCTPRGCSLIDPTVERGVVRAPLLSRIEVAADVWGTEVNVVHLSSFIDNNLRFGNRSSLELFIDTANGVRLAYPEGSDPDAVLNQLRTCVGTLLM